MAARRRRLLAAWSAAALALGTALVAAQVGQDPRNDPDLALQRPGFLDFQHGPFPAPPVTPGIPSAGRRAVVVFVRPDVLWRIAEALAGDAALRQRADEVIVVSGTPPANELAGITVVGDADGRLAAGYMMRRPRDGGPPVGYAVVDTRGRVRYATLDPAVATLLDEVETIVQDTP